MVDKPQTTPVKEGDLNLVRAFLQRARQSSNQELEEVINAFERTALELEELTIEVNLQ
jgi:hypothetical protein